MALKWNDLLDSIIGDLSKGYKASIQKNAAPKLDLSETTQAFKAAKVEAEKLKKATIEVSSKYRDTRKKIDELKDALKASNLTAETEKKLRFSLTVQRLKERALTEEQLKLEDQSADTQKRLTSETKALDDALNKTGNSIRKMNGSFEDVENSYKASLKSLIESGQDTEQALDAIKFEKLIGNLNAGLFNSKTDDLLKKGGEMLGSAVGEGLSKTLGPIGMVVGKAFEVAFNQALELNTALTNLQRSMGGVVSASQLGFDALGNSSKGMSSLASQAIAANVSVDQFGDAIKSLGPTFGQTIGMTADLGKSQKDLAKFGIAAAQAQKLYGANIGPSVAKLSQNFGKSIGEATDVMMKGAEAAKSLGLNVGEFAKNFEAVADMVGEVYFRSTEAMQQMAMIATQLGTSVAAIAGAIPKMKGINDLFKQQQNMAALGMSSTAASLGKIYALQKQGRSDEAAKLALSSQAKDLVKQGLVDDKGGISQQGIATAEAAGMGKEQIEALQKMALQAQRTGLSFDQLGGQVQLTKQQQKTLDKDMQNSMSLNEQAAQIVGGLKQSLVDPIAELIGPLMKSLMNAIQPLAKALGSAVRIVLDIFDPLVGGVTEIFNQISLAYQDVWNPIANLFKGVGDTFGGFMNVLKSIGKFITAVLFIPFRILGKIIGGVISVFAKIWQVIAEKLSPIFDKLSGLFEGGGTMIEDALGLITDAFGWLANLIGGAVGFVLDGLVGALSGLWDGVILVIDILKNVLEPFTWLKDIIKDVVDWFNNLIGSDDGEALTPVDLRTAGFSGAAEAVTPNVPIASAAIDFGKNDQAAEAKRLEKEANMQFTNTAPVNVTTNVKTDGLFNNAQQIKSPN